MADWPHAPLHRLSPNGTYIVTAGTYLKKHVLTDDRRLSLVCDALLDLADECGWALQAWAVLANHYHFIAAATERSGDLSRMLQRLHASTAIKLNALDETPGRRVWFQFWDTRLTYQRSYLARLNYVHRNAVHHGLVERASEYLWCSAAWFEREAAPSFFKTVTSFKIDRLKVVDDF